MSTAIINGGVSQAHYGDNPDLYTKTGQIKTLTDDIGNPEWEIMHVILYLSIHHEDSPWRRLLEAAFRSCLMERGMKRVLEKMREHVLEETGKTKLSYERD